MFENADRGSEAPAEPFGRIALLLPSKLGRSLGRRRALVLQGSAGASPTAGHCARTLSELLTRGIGVGRPVRAPSLQAVPPL